MGFLLYNYQEQLVPVNFLLRVSTEPPLPEDRSFGCESIGSFFYWWLEYRLAVMLNLFNVIDIVVFQHYTSRVKAEKDTRKLSLWIFSYFNVIIL